MLVCLCFYSAHSPAGRCDFLPLEGTVMFFFRLGSRPDQTRICVFLPLWSVFSFRFSRKPCSRYLCILSAKPVYFFRSTARFQIGVCVFFPLQAVFFFRFPVLHLAWNCAFLPRSKPNRALSCVFLPLKSMFFFRFYCFSFPLNLLFFSAHYVVFFRLSCVFLPF